MAQTSNAVMIIPIDRNIFCPDIFIKEQENYSIAFDGQLYSKKKGRNYYDDFPSSGHKAN
jgi:hypothetical protein